MMYIRQGYKLKFAVGLFVAFFATFYVFVSVLDRLKVGGFDVDPEAFNRAIGYASTLKAAQNGMVGNERGDVYLYGPAPSKSNWIEVARVKIEDNIFYPVYYTQDGYQVIRKNPANDHFYVHALINGAHSVFFVIDTGATRTFVNDMATVERISLNCEQKGIYVGAASEKVLSSCHEFMDEVNINGFVSTLDDNEGVAANNIHFPDYQDKGHVEKISVDGSVHLLGMNVIGQFDFVMKGDYLFIRPSKDSHFKTGDAIKRLVAYFDNQVEQSSVIETAR